MKPKIAIITFIILAATVTAIYFTHYVYSLGFKSVPMLTVTQLNADVQKAGGDGVLGEEATKAIARFNTKKISDFTSCPAITQFAALVKGAVIDIVPNDADGAGVPAHVLIRRGGHFDYQFVYIFGAGTGPTTNSVGLQQIAGTIYLRNTAK